MMVTFILSFAIISLALLGMAVGVLFGRQPLEGGCGRPVDGKGGVEGCEVCGAERAGSS